MTLPPRGSRTEPLPDQSNVVCEECGDTGLVRVHSAEDYGVSFESEACEHCSAGLRHLEPEERADRVQAAVLRALGHLSMTQCPYFDHEGVCEGGCYSEPACITDQPTEGWVRAAIKELKSVTSDEEGQSNG